MAGIKEITTLTYEIKWTSSDGGITLTQRQFEELEEWFAYRAKRAEGK